MLSDIQPPDSSGSGSLLDAAAALPGLPQLHSLPGAAAFIYLDFNGGTYSGKTYDPYDTDGDMTSFNSSEQSDITDCWKDISVYFAPFDVDVTTVKPSGPTAWDIISNSQSGGVSTVNAFPNGSSPASKNQSSDARGRTSGIAHELGHNFGLYHQAEYDNLGNQTAEYSDGYDATHGPIMGVDYARDVHKWFIGHPHDANPNGASAIQNDLAIITNAIKGVEGAGGDGYREDDYGGTIASATAMNGTATFTASGIIERPTDVDAFSFPSAGGYTVIDVKPTTVSALAPKLDLFDANGNRVGAIDDTSYRGDVDNDIRLIVDVPSAGTYYALVAGHGDYDDQGQYSVTVRQLPDGWTTQDVGSVGVEGYATFVNSSGVYTVAGSGADIAGAADEFRYAWLPFRGDATIIARVTNVDNTDDGAKVGLMIRDSLSSGSPHAAVVATSNNGVRFLDRQSSGGSTDNTGSGGAFSTIYLKLTRVGDKITGYKSTDGGQNWNEVSHATVSMSTNNYIGLVTTSHKDGTLNVGKLDNITITGSNINPPPSYNSLPAPTGFSVTPDDASDLNLSWNNVSGNTGYVIERSLDGYSFSQIGTTSANDTTYTDDKPFGAMRWFYRVSAKDASGNSPPSAFKGAVNTPNAVTNVLVESLSKTQLVLNWRDVAGDNGYRIERSTDGTSFTTLTTTGKNVPIYSDTGLKAGTTYTYRVTPVNSSGDGIPKTFTGTTRVGAANNLTFVERASDHVKLDWSVVTGATGYHVERSTNGTSFTNVGDVAAPASSYTDNTVSPLKSYYYRVTAFNDVTDGDVSAVIWGSTPNAPAVPSPGPWADTDIGNPDGLGASGFTSNKLTILSNGDDIGGTADTFHFVYMPLFGDGQIIAKVSSLEATNDGAEAGVMIRDSLADDAKVGFLEITAASGAALLFRNASGDAMSKTGSDASIAAPYWLKLVRSGTTLTGYDSPDGQTWTKVASITTQLGNGTFIGLAATSHDVAQMNTSTFTNIDVDNEAPTVANAAKANPKPVTSYTTNLTVLGADDHDAESGLTYDWSVTQKPSGGSVSFSDHNSNAAKNVTATFNKAGTYQLTATITDSFGLTATSSVTLDVIAGPVLLSAGSRRVHGSTNYDVGLPLTGNSGIEPRNVASGWSMVLNFDKAIASVGSASVTAGTGNAGAVTLSGNSVIVPITGAVNAQSLTLTLSNLVAGDGGLLDSAAVTVRLLKGDINADGSVNISDINLTKAMSGAALTLANFRRDVNADGNVNISDINTVKAASGTTVSGGSSGDTVPTLSAFTNQTINQGQSTGPIAFTVGDAETPVGTLYVTATSDNPTLLPDSSNFVFGGNGASRTLNITPDPSQSGAATITVSVNDGLKTTIKTFVLTVLAA